MLFEQLFRLKPRMVIVNPIACLLLSPHHYILPIDSGESETLLYKEICAKLRYVCYIITSDFCINIRMIVKQLFKDYRGVKIEIAHNSNF